MHIVPVIYLCAEREHLQLEHQSYQQSICHGDSNILLLLKRPRCVYCVQFSPRSVFAIGFKFTVYIRPSQSCPFDISCSSRFLPISQHCCWLPFLLQFMYWGLQACVPSKVFNLVCIQTKSYGISVLIIYRGHWIVLCVGVKKNCYGQWNCLIWWFELFFLVVILSEFNV
jgi:hypothetical protein